MRAPSRWQPSVAWATLLRRQPSWASLDLPPLLRCLLLWTTLLHAVTVARPLPPLPPCLQAPAEEQQASKGIPRALLTAGLVVLAAAAAIALGGGKKAAAAAPASQQPAARKVWSK